MTDDIVFLQNEDDFDKYALLTPRYKFDRKKIRFICKKCGKNITRRFLGMTKDFLCKNCAISKGRNSVEAKEKYKQTCMEKYGVENPSQNEDIKQKKIQTSLKNYNVENPAQSDTVQNKIKNTNMKRFGVESFSKTERYKEKYKQTCMEKYGVENPSQNEDIKQKKIDTCNKNHNCDFPMQAEAILKKSFESKVNIYGQYNISYSFYYDNKNFDSSWELAYYIWLKDHNVKFKYKPKVKFEYTYDGKIHFYFPDFVVNNEYHEIKGTQFFENNDVTKKMVNPYDHSLDALFEEKHQCMIKNNVKIITNCEKYIDYVSTRYGQSYINQFSKLNIDSIYKALPKEFPYYRYDIETLQNDFNSLLTNINMQSGLKIIKHYYKNIYMSRVGKYKSPVEAWSDENIMKKVIANRIQYKNKYTLDILRQGLTIMKIAPKVSIFRPYLAFNLIKKYLNDYDIVFDPFSGFGGRMLGTVAAGKKYIGQDINEDTVKSSRDIIDTYDINATVYVKNMFDSYGTYECLLTCPPYNLKEIWNNNETDLNCDQWIDECLNRFSCKKYLFIVDKTNKYKNNIVEIIENKSHFGTNNEYVLLIDALSAKNQKISS